jgi:NAD(P)-dependent dehydrogenase (short-subunit alcohol dehydrogenase family)
VITTETDGLHGRVALVTGGSRGIGAAVALRLARDGADVAITYRTAADRAAQVVEEIERLGRRGLALEADRADPADAEHAEHQRGLTSLGRFQTADEVAATVAHLAGAGGGTITGAALLVDAGTNA